MLATLLDMTSHSAQLRHDYYNNMASQQYAETTLCYQVFGERILQIIAGEFREE